MMIMGAVAGFGAMMATKNPWVGILAGILVGGAMSLIHAFLVISLRAHQILSGISLTMFGLGLSAILGKPLLGVSAHGIAMEPVHVPLLSDIPGLGPVLFQQDPIVYISFLLIPLMWIILFKTEIGLSIRAVGDDPLTADTLGINVYRIRYACVLVGGLLAGLAGAYLSVAYARVWTEGMTAGRGWIVIALTLFSLWNPLRAVIGAYLFGGVIAVQYAFQAIGVPIAPEFLLMTPYISTIVILIVVSKEMRRRRVGVPAALYKPYVRGER